MKQVLINNKPLVEIDECSFDLEDKENFVYLEMPTKFQHELEVFFAKNNSHKEHSDYYKLRTFYKIFWCYNEDKYMWRYILCVNGEETEENQDLEKEEYRFLKNICKEISIYRRKDQFKVDLT